MANAQTAVLGARQMTEEELQVESARGRMVGLASVLAVAMFSAFIFLTWLAMRDASGGNNAKKLATIADNKLPFIASGFCFAIAAVLVSAVLVHLILAARSRSEAVPKIALYLAIAGPVLSALVYPVYTLTQVSVANKFVDGSAQTAAAATDLLGSGANQITTSAYLFAQLLVAIAWVMAGLWGMRLGLVTRLVGAVAIAIGFASVVVPPLAALLQVFWISAFAIMLLGDGPQTPPAWKLGRPVSWREVAANAAAGDAAESPSDFNKSEQ
ncbi:MAG: hypothetical protein JHD02_07345 [Thermoleophilaceae bacterium]|nr:hypothetical protein [Thermoleophilaceae bacterium]